MDFRDQSWHAFNHITTVIRKIRMINLAQNVTPLCAMAYRRIVALFANIKLVNSRD